MFTGIVQAIGTLKAMTKKGRGFEIIMEVGEDFDLKNKVELGDSVAHNGVCCKKRQCSIYRCRGL